MSQNTGKIKEGINGSLHKKCTHTYIFVYKPYIYTFMYMLHAHTNIYTVKKIEMYYIDYVITPGL